MAAWAEFAEVFGSPVRIGKTDVRDETTRRNMENMMKNMSVASWAVLDLNDSIDLVQASRTDAYQVFDKMVERCNSEISKIILGQTGTTDEKSYSGSANVHENVAAMIGKQDIVNMEFMVNNQLIPMMIRLGFPLQGYKFEYDTTEQLSLMDQLEIDKVLMTKYNLNIEYLEQKYNVEIDDADSAAEGELTSDVVNIAKRLKNLYSV
jgi:phage gp29-like protein